MQVPLPSLMGLCHSSFEDVKLRNVLPKKFDEIFCGENFRHKEDFFS